MEEHEILITFFCPLSYKRQVKAAVWRYLFRISSLALTTAMVSVFFTELPSDYRDISLKLTGSYENTYNNVLISIGSKQHLKLIR